LSTHVFAYFYWVICSVQSLNLKVFCISPKFLKFQTTQEKFPFSFFPSFLSFRPTLSFGPAAAQLPHPLLLTRPSPARPTSPAAQSPSPFSFSPPAQLAPRLAERPRGPASAPAQPGAAQRLPLLPLADRPAPRVIFLPFPFSPRRARAGRRVRGGLPLRPSPNSTPRPRYPFRLRPSLPRPRLPFPALARAVRSSNSDRVRAGPSLPRRLSFSPPASRCTAPI